MPVGTKDVRLQRTVVNLEQAEGTQGPSVLRGDMLMEGNGRVTTTCNEHL